MVTSEVLKVLKTARHIILKQERRWAAVLESRGHIVREDAVGDVLKASGINKAIEQLEKEL